MRAFCLSSRQQKNILSRTLFISGERPAVSLAGRLTDGERSAMPKEIPLTQGRVALVSDCDFERLSQWPWYYGRGYAIRGRRKADGPGSRLIWMHRVILGDIPEGLESDHIDRNGLNNQRSNLRLATSSQNHVNSKLQSNNTSGYRGVSWEERYGKWRGQIGVKGRQLFLGYFDDIIGAARAYNQAALEHFGEFAVLNPI